MLHKLLLSALAACMVSLLPSRADDAFRQHRYSSFQATPVTEQSTVFVGNSITNMQPWAELFTVPNVVNRGNSGGFSWEILSNVQSYIAGRPAKLFIMIGTNDMNVAGYTPEAVVANVRQTVKHIQKESPATQVFVESVMPSTNGSRTVAKVEELNRQLKAMAGEMGVTYVDYFDALMGCTNGTMSYDNLHPHVVGTRAWTAAVASHVGGEAVLPASPIVKNGGEANSYGARTSVFAQLPVGKDDVLFIGDEFVHGGEWQELLGNPNVKNRGTGWGKWGPSIGFQKTCVPLILKGLADNEQPKQVLLMIGSQQLTSSSADLEAIKAQYKECIAAVRAEAPTTKLSLVSVIPYGATATNINTRNLVPINAWLKATAEATDNTEYIDLYSALTTDNTAIAKYIDGNQYVTGLGYQACARVLANHIEGCTVMSEAEAEAYYELIGARKELSNAIDGVELSNAGIELDTYYALLANDAATATEITAAATALNAALDAALKPTPGKWYTMTATRNTSVFFTKAATGNGFAASATIAADGSSYWELVAKGDGTYDIRNGQGYYAVPIATHNVQLNLSQSQPATGWSFEGCDAAGAFNVTAKVGTATVNCCMNLTGQNTIFNWTTGRAADQGCQIVFAETDFDPSTVVVPEEKDEYELTITMQNGTLYRGGNAQATGWVNQWKSSMTDPFQLTLTAPANNIDAANCTGGTLKIAAGQVQGSLTFAVSNQDFYVKSYSFNVTAGNDNQTIKPNGADAVDIRTNAASAISWENNASGNQTASFEYKGQNVDAVFTDIKVVVARRTIAPEPQTNLFEYGSPGNNICYRIPAIATAHNGNVIAMTDYRYGGADIGFGRVSLRYRISKDNGETWGDIKTLQESHQGQYGVDKADDLWAGFGDPALVADRESSRVLALSCCGNVSYPGGTWNHHQGIARFRSEDNGETWETFGEPVDGIECHWQDIAPGIYQQFKDGGVEPAAMFVGSGRIFQSRFTKVAQYYRIYCVVLLRTAAQGGLNYVLFSDDFGDTWDILGGDNFTAGVTGGDEPKAEELPDGSVLLSSRTYGRIFNIFRFTDVAKGEGSWMTQATSNAQNNGTVEEGNACNGEIMILPVVRKADSKKMWLALQSVPFGPGGRYNVGIYYKGLDCYEKFSTPANFAKNWDGRHQASFMSSGYSTMTLQHDNHIGFMYEEDTFGKSYTQVYKRYSIEQITDSLYTLDTDPINPFAITADGIEALTTSVTYSNYVGGLLPEAETSIAEALEAFKATPSQENYIAIFTAIAEAPCREFDPAVRYVVRNCNRGGAGAYAMCVDNSAKLKTKAYNATDAMQQWSFVPTEADGYFYIYNAQTKSYITDLPARETAMQNTTDLAKAGEYRLQRMGGDHFAMVNKTPTAANLNAIHAPGDYETRMVCWTPEGDASQWFFEATELPADNPTAVLAPHSATSAAVGTHIYDLQGRLVTRPHHGIYITDGHKVAY